MTYSTDSFLAPPGKAGQLIGSEFSAELLYEFGSMTQFVPAVGSLTPFSGTDGDAASFAGIFFDDTLPGGSHDSGVCLRAHFL